MSMWILGSVRRGCSARALVIGLTCALALGLGANAFGAGVSGLAADANTFAADANQVPNLVPGTELLITNLSGTSLVGYGLVDSEGLTLFLSSTAATLQVIVVLPGESPRHFLGEVIDERVYLMAAAGERVDVARALAGVGRTLTLEFADGRTVPVAVAAGDEEPGETASDAPAVTGDEPASGTPTMPGDEPASAPESPASEPQRPSVTRPTPPELPDAATDRPGAPAPPAAEGVPGGVPGRGVPGQPGPPVAPGPPGWVEPPGQTPPEPGAPPEPPVVSPPGPPVSPPVGVPADPHDDDDERPGRP